MELDGEGEEKEEVKGGEDQGQDQDQYSPMELFEKAWLKLNRQFTPAQLEQLVAECDTLQELPKKLAGL